MENKLIKYEQENYLKVVAYKDGDVLVYSTTLNFDEIVQLLAPVKLAESDEIHVNDIIDNIIKNPNIITLPNLTISVSKELPFKQTLKDEAFCNPLEHTDFPSISGYIKINEQTVFNVLDGNKRIHAIRKIVNNSSIPLDDKCQLSVDIYVQDGIK